MADGTVTATSLNLRDAPQGKVINLLVRDTPVSVLEQNGAWLRISASVEGQTQLGWVSADWVSLGAAAVASPMPIPPPDDPAHPVTVKVNKAIGPDGRSFATLWKTGFVTYGKTPLTDWLKANPAPPALTPSMVRAIRAASLNEGKLEAINSWDDAFLSFGMFQWTAGVGDDPGELAAFLDRVQRADANALQEYFGRHALGVATASPTSVTGLLTIEGSELRSAAAKEQLRGPEWAYRFWRAGHDDTIRRCQLLHAGARIDRFYYHPAAGRRIADWLTSEYGVALVLDEHINRPGHVPRTLEQAIADWPGGAPDPGGWTTAEEQQLVSLYIEARNASGMTDPDGRAAQIADCVHDGTLSDQRGSFVTPAAATGV